MIKLKKNILVELLLIFALLLVFVPVFFASYSAIFKQEEVTDQSLQAVELLDQAVAVVEFIKQKNLNLLMKSGSYHPEVYNKEWILVSGHERIGNFSRVIEIQDTEDKHKDNKKIKITVSWNEGNLKTEKEFYLSDL